MKTKPVITTGLLITGTGRSGTGLLWKILNAHSKLNIAYEPFNTEHFCLTDLKYFNGIKQPAFHWGFENCQADKYIFMKRGVWDTLYSILKRNNHKYDRALEFYLKIVKINRKIYNFNTTHKDKSLIVTYESLCLNSEATVREICTFLGLSFEKKMLTNWADIKTPEWATTCKYITSAIILQTNLYKKDKEFLKVKDNIQSRIRNERKNNK